MDEVRVEELLIDNVNHPAHYEGQTSMECIEAMQISFGKKAVIDFCMCNAFKYLWRHRHKNGREDLQKAHWYLDKADKLIGLDGDLYESVPEQLGYMDNLIGEYMRRSE
jgi:hypothetical protein